MKVPRINYDLPRNLHHAMKVQAAIKGQTLKDYVIQALERAVAEDEKRKPKR